MMHHDWRQFWVELVNVKIQPQLLCNVKVKYFLIPHNACCNLMHVAIWWATSSSHVIVNSKTQLLRIQFSIWPTITNRLTYRHPRVTLLSSDPVNGQTHSKNSSAWADKLFECVSRVRKSRQYSGSLKKN